MSETAILSEFKNAVMSRPHYSARGFHNVNCPACGDRRKRGGFAPTPTGGFRYFCYNAGCTFNEQPTGWEPGNGLVGRVATLFRLLGCSIKAIPLKERMVTNVERQDSVEVATKFSTRDLPGGSMPIMKALEKFGDRAAPAVEYLFSRGDFYLYPDYENRFWWSVTIPDFVLIPFFHHDRVVGYMGRSIRKGVDGTKRFIQSAEKEYLFDQHRIKNMSKHVLVMESPMSAIPLGGVASRSNRLSPKQVNLLKVSDKIPVLIPDYKGEEWKPYLNVAEQEGWPIATPNWKYKDVGAAMQDMGCANALMVLMESMTVNYKMAEIVIKKNIMVVTR